MSIIVATVLKYAYQECSDHVMEAVPYVVLEPYHGIYFTESHWARSFFIGASLDAFFLGILFSWKFY